MLDPRNPRLQYMAAENAGIWRSRDGGANWTEMNDDRALRHGRPRHRPEASQGAVHVRLGPIRHHRRRLPIRQRRLLMDEHLRGHDDELRSTLAITPNGRRLYVGSGDGDYGGGGVFAANVR